LECHPFARLSGPEKDNAIRGDCNPGEIFVNYNPDKFGDATALFCESSKSGIVSDF